MAEFTIISTTSRVILKMLTDNLCENNENDLSESRIKLIEPNDIKLISPNATSGDYQLGLHLYDIKEIGEYRRSVPLMEGNFRSQPPKLLELYYMLFCNPNPQMVVEAEKEQVIFGRALQVLYDASIIKFSNLANSNILSQSEESVSVSVLNHSFEEKVKIWSAFQKPYRLSIGFTVSPVNLSSRRISEVTRVTDIKLESKVQEVTLEALQNLPN